MPAVYNPASSGAGIFQYTAHPDQVGVLAAPTNQTVYVETDSNHKAGVYVHTHNLQSDRDYAGGDTVRTTKGGLYSWVDVDNNDAAWNPIQIAGAGIQSIMQSGPTAQSYGTLIAYIAEVFVKNVPTPHGNEYSCFYATILAGAWNNTITGGNYWHFDHALHAPLGQPGLLVGYSLVTNNHYNGSPSQGPATAICLQTHPTAGGQFNNFCVGGNPANPGLTTYPWDIGYFVGGYTTGGTGDGYTNAIQVGGLPGAWIGSGGRDDYGGDFGQVARGVIVKARRAGTSCARLGAFISEGTGEAGGLVFGLDTGDANRASLYRSANTTLSLRGQIIPVSLVSAASDSAAATGGVPVGGLYQNAGTVKVRLV